MMAINGYTVEGFKRHRLSATPAHGPLLATVLHHTYRPTRASDRGLSTVKGVQHYHVHTNGWSDIGANAYASHDGRIYNGRPLDWSNYAHAYIQRPWRRIPPSLRNMAQGSRQFLNHRAFGLEVIGDYDKENPAASTAMTVGLDLLAAVHERFHIPVERCFFHRDVAYKSCPGGRVQKAWVRQELRKRLTGIRVVKRPGDTRIDCSPRLIGGRTFVGLRAFAEALGFNVHADMSDDTIYISGGE